MSNDNNPFGKPTYGQNSDWPWKISPIKEDKANTYRIFPQMGALRENGRGWVFYHRVHYGFRGVSKAPNKPGPMRVFKCPRKRDKDKNVLVDCAMCQKVDKIQAAADQRKAKLMSEGQTEQQAMTTLANVYSWLRQYNIGGKWYMGAKTPENERVVVPVSTSTLKLLDQEFEKLRNESGIDPVAADQGVWVTFLRTRVQNRVTDTPHIVTESFVAPNGRKGSQPKLAPLTEDDYAYATAHPLELKDFFRVLTTEQIEMLAGCSGDPEEVDRVWGLSEAAAPQKAYEEEDDESYEPSAAPVSTSPGPTAYQGLGEVGSIVVTNGGAEIIVPAAVATTNVAPPAAKAPTKSPVLDFPDNPEDFIKMIGDR